MTPWSILIEETFIETKVNTISLIKILTQQFKRILKFQSFGTRRGLLMQLVLKKIPSTLARIF